MNLTATEKSPWMMWKNRLVVLLFIAPVCLSLTGAGEALHAAWLQEWLGAQGVKGVLAYCALTAFLSVFGVPRQALTALGGYAFGAGAGCLWASVGLFAGCACSFSLARHLTAGPVRKRLGPRLRAMDKAFAEQPFAGTLMLRLCPLGNNALLNMAAGVSSVPARPFFAATLVGYLPQNIVFALLGSGVSSGSASIVAVSGIVFLLSMALGYRCYQRYCGYRACGSDRPETPAQKWKTARF